MDEHFVYIETTNLGPDDLGEYHENLWCRGWVILSVVDKRDREVKKAWFGISGAQGERFKVAQLKPKMISGATGRATRDVFNIGTKSFDCEKVEWQYPDSATGAVFSRARWVTQHTTCLVEGLPFKARIDAIGDMWVQGLHGAAWEGAPTFKGTVVLSGFRVTNAIAHSGIFQLPSRPNGAWFLSTLTGYGTDGRQTLQVPGVPVSNRGPTADSGSPAGQSGEGATGRITLKNGDVLTGEILTPEFTIETGYANLVFRLSEIDSVNLGQGGEDPDSLVLIRGDRFTGIVKLASVKIRLTPDQEVELRKGEVREIRVGKK